MSENQPEDRVTPAAVGRDDSSRRQIDAYITANRDRVTPDAIRREFVGAGYRAEEVDAALADAGLRATEAPAPTPRVDNPRREAALWLIGLYALTWGAFAVLGDWQRPYMAAGLWILAAVLGVVGGIGLVYIAVTPQLRDAGRQAIAIVLVVPIIFLVVIAGICAPTVR